MSNSNTAVSHLKELTFQLTVTRAMLGALDLDQVLYIILSGITHGEGLNFNRAVLFLARERRAELRVSAAAGPVNQAEAHRIWEEIEAEGLDLECLLNRFGEWQNPSVQTLTRQLSAFSVRLDQPPPTLAPGAQALPLSDVVAHCANAKLPFFSNDVVAVYPTPDGETVHFSCLACVPILLHDQVVGVILVDNAFNHRLVQPEELRALSTLANLAGIAIDKAQLHAHIKEMACRDGLTGVLNRGYYETRLADEVQRATRLGRSLSLIVFDIDHFKCLNDEHGHEVGDLALKGVASILKQHLRAEDVVARYGGEEFVVLLTGGVGEGDAFAVAEKLRRAIAAHAFAPLEAGRVTASAGVASLEAHQLDGAALFRRADKALYRAKMLGRNQTVAASSLS